MGRSIYFSDQELKMIRKYIGESVSILGESEDCNQSVNEDMENGLGSALRKLYKGCNGEKVYAKYKTQRKVKKDEVTEGEKNEIYD